MIIFGSERDIGDDEGAYEKNDRNGELYQIENIHRQPIRKARGSGHELQVFDTRQVFLQRMSDVESDGRGEKNEKRH